MQLVVQKVADSLARSENFRREVARYLVKENLLEEAFSLRPSGQGDKIPPVKEDGSLLTRKELVDYVESIVPSDILEGCRYKTKYELIRYLELEWQGLDAVSVVEQALGEPNSDSSLTTEIGRRSVRRFISRWVNPYIEALEYFEETDEEISVTSKLEPAGPMLEELVSVNLSK